MRSITTKLFTALMLFVCALAFTASAEASVTLNDGTKIIIVAAGTDAI